MELLYYILLGIHLFFLLIVVYNFFTAPAIKNKKTASGQSRKISVLIPARNEEANIGACLDSVLDQSFLNLEVIVLDDQSEDRTAAVVNERIIKDDRLKLIEGKPLPQNWLGKNWACYQLAEESESDLMLFIDADIQLSRFAVENAFDIFEKYNLQMLSSFPTQRMKSFGEWLIVPLMNWLLLTFLPLKFVYTTKNKSFAAANGQFIMLDEITYNKIGGHESVKDKVVEDMELIRKIKSNGFKGMTTLGGNAVFCRMYNGFADSIKGFTKNFFAGFNTTRSNFILMITIFLILFLSPFFIAIINLSFLWVVLIILFQRILISAISYQSSIINTLLHPFQMTMMIFVGIKSVFAFNTKKVKWKGREIN